MRCRTEEEEGLGEGEKGIEAFECTKDTALKSEGNRRAQYLIKSVLLWPPQHWELIQELCPPMPRTSTTETAEQGTTSFSPCGKLTRRTGVSE